VTDNASAGEPAAAPEPDEVPLETAGAGPDPAPAGTEAGEHELSELEVVTAQRDEYLDHLRRVQAEFENYRKRVARQQSDAVEQAAGRLAEALLPVLDACDGAVRHGAEEVQPVYAALLGTLEKEGLERVDPGGEAFDPTLHEAVMHEPADGDEAGPIVSDVLRPGYTWKSRVLRPAMVKVKG
jgi:molecular chaperone GrpE